MRDTTKRVAFKPLHNVFFGSYDNKYFTFSKGESELDDSVEQKHNQIEEMRYL